MEAIGAAPAARAGAAAAWGVLDSSMLKPDPVEDDRG
jgi:hypothetical protein